VVMGLALGSSFINNVPMIVLALGAQRSAR
jgi:hypothetical protein